MVEIVHDIFQKSYIRYEQSECVKLHLSVVQILGFEHYKSARRIQWMIDKIEDSRSKIPPVFLVPTENDLEYRITLIPDFTNPDNLGGHHRAIAHYILGTPLKALILNEKMVKRCEDRHLCSWPRFPSLIPIQDTIIE